MQGYLKEELQKVLKEKYNLSGVEFKVERPKRKEFGDLATNVAFILSKHLKRNPFEIAQELARELEKNPSFESVEVAKPAFINVRFSKDYYYGVLKDILTKGFDYFRENLGLGRRVQVEYVSANPTGPLHLGHGRGAVVGDVISNLLEFYGWDVTREYYINDAGNQIRMLGISILYRYLELMLSLVYEGAYSSQSYLFAPPGEATKKDKLYARISELFREIGEEFEQNGYRGEYVKELAQKVYDLYREQILELPKEESINFLSEFGLKEMLEEIKRDLEDFGITFDVWFSEKSLYQTRYVEKTLNYLREKGLLYEKDGAVWFKTTEFGDDKDRVVIKKDGSYTYFASDIAYHYNKYLRGFHKVIDVWGADHHGYVPRVKAAIKAFGVPENWLDVELVQLVKLFRDGKEVKMSKRAGNFVTLRELLDEVGKDVIRFWFITKRSDTPLEFDIDKAKEESSENPVFYVQYAHARISGIFREVLNRKGFDAEVEFEFKPELLSSETELELIKHLATLRDELISIAQSREIHLLPNLAVELVKRFHYYYNHYRVMVDDEELMKARLALLKAIRTALRLIFHFIGISAPERM
ncbi:MAG TPA: arginine--tRNA ligase [Aquificales bacterium]|nr:arginine--tRNA ligase [Aquificales bacterium]HIO41536.1 arginine--tRNA ligase [Aquifex sp.]